jgi:hypothetical protein
MVQMGMMKIGSFDTRNHLFLLPGEVMLKVRTIVKVLVKTVEIATKNTIPNVVCCKMQVAVLRWAMKNQ